ncbi:hypothetical protein [Azospirillum cavernae]|nr:hypothetical protein [Azospirillum cavernae]
MLHIAALSPRDTRERSKILDLGMLSGCEHLRAYDWQDGWVVEGIGALRSAVSIPSQLEERLLDPCAELYIHHNHPDGGAFSRNDLVLALDLMSRARGKLYAHGHDGSTYSVMFANRRYTDLLYRFLADRIREVLSDAIKAGQLSRAVAHAHFAHAVCLVFDQAGIMHYEFVLSQGRLDGWLEHADCFDEAIQVAVRAIGR